MSSPSITSGSRAQSFASLLAGLVLAPSASQGVTDEAVCQKPSDRVGAFTNSIQRAQLALIDCSLLASWLGDQKKLATVVHSDRQGQKEEKGELRRALMYKRVKLQRATRERKGRKGARDGNEAAPLLLGLIHKGGECLRRPKRCV
jgi:hypothetical protein